MSLEELRNSLLQEAQAEARKVVSKAGKEAEERLASAKTEARKIVSEAREKAVKQATAETNERRSAAQLRAKKITSEARNQVLRQGLEKAWKEFRSLPSDKVAYEKLMKRLVTRAEKGIGEGAVVKVNSRDQALARKFSDNVAKEPADIAGGAVVSTKDGSISIDNSLEALFAEKEDVLRKLIYTEIWGKKK